MADDNASFGFTTDENKIITCIMKHLKGDIQVSRRAIRHHNITTDTTSQADLEAVACELGYKDASVAKTRWNQIKRKKIAGVAGATPAKASPGKRKKVVDQDDDDEETTPAKKKGGKKGKKAQVDGKSTSTSCLLCALRAS